MPYRSKARRSALQAMQGLDEVQRRMQLAVLRRALARAQA